MIPWRLKSVEHICLEYTDIELPFTPLYVCIYVCLTILEFLFDNFENVLIYSCRTNRDFITLTLKEQILQMHAMAGLQLYLIVSIGLKVAHGMDVMDSLCAPTVQYDIFHDVFTLMIQLLLEV